MLNTRVSINKFVEQIIGAAALPVTITFEDVQEIPAAAGERPAVFIRYLGETGEPTRHMGRLTPQTGFSSLLNTVTFEIEVRTKSATFNQAAHIADILQQGIDEEEISIQSWLLDDVTPNESPQIIGHIRFSRSTLTPLADPEQPQFKSVFISWTDVQTEVNI